MAEEIMPKTVDARGLACPQPVLLTRAALAASDAVLTIVDNPTAQHNVTRMAEKAGYTVAVEQRDDGIYLDICKAEVEAEAEIEVERKPPGRLCWSFPALPWAGATTSWATS